MTGLWMPAMWDGQAVGELGMSLTNSYLEPADQEDDDHHHFNQHQSMCPSSSSNSR